MRHLIFSAFSICLVEPNLWPTLKKPRQTGRENPAKPTLGYLHGFALRRNPTKPAETPEPHPHPIGPPCNLGRTPLPLLPGMTTLLPQARAFLLFCWEAQQGDFFIFWVQAGI